MLMEIIILDNNKKRIGNISAKDGSNPFFDDIYKLDLVTGAETIELSVELDNQLSIYLEEGNYLLFIWHDKIKMFQIKTADDEEVYDTVQRQIYAESIALELLNGYVRETTIEGNMKKFLKTVLMDTNYQVGYVSPSLENLIATMSLNEPTAVYSVLQQAVPLYNNVEFEFECVEVDCVKGQYSFKVNCYADGERGNKTYKRFEYDYNSYGMKRSGDITDFAAGLIGVGNNGITFKDLEWIEANGDPMDKPVGQDFLLDLDVHNKHSMGGKPIITKYKTDDTSASDLLFNTYYKLQEIKQKKFTYDIPVYLTPDELAEVNIGDTVYIINNKFNPPILLEARISVLEISFTDPSKCKVTLSNYKEVKSKIREMTPNDIINSTLDIITGMGVGKLTMADIMIIKDFLGKLDTDNEQLQKIVEDLINKLSPEIPKLPVIAEDDENYKKIYLKETDDGLWLGDERIYDLRKYNCGIIKTTETPVIIPDEPGLPSDPGIVLPPSNDKNVNYDEAKKYYAKFNLGLKGNASYNVNLRSPNNKYKFNTIVRYWSTKFGVDPNLVFALIQAESSGNPYANAAAYGCMQCEKAAYFGDKQTIKYVDGSTTTFTPSYSTMRPGGSITLNGVKVDRGISNQIMFGCNELRKSFENFNGNVFATLVGYNFGIYGCYWTICKYVCDKYNYKFVDTRSLSAQCNACKTQYYKELDGMKCNWSSYRKTYKNRWHAGTASNIEGYLQHYYVEDKQLPYFVNKAGKKIGYGVSSELKSTGETPLVQQVQRATPRAAQFNMEVRNKIVDKAIEITKLHQVQRIATYDQGYRTVDDTKRRRHPGTFYGIKNPICYDCSSLVSCAYLHAGLNSVYSKSCQAGTLVASANKGNKAEMWLCNEEGVKRAQPGDIIMKCKYSRPTQSHMNSKSPPTTCHTLIYCGNRMIAHASEWKYPTQAIRYEKIDWYIQKGMSFFLRPWDLLEADKKAPVVKPPNNDTTDDGVEGGSGSSSGVLSDIGNPILSMNGGLFIGDEFTVGISTQLISNGATVMATTGYDAENFYDKGVVDKTDTFPVSPTFVFIMLGYNKTNATKTNALLSKIKSKYRKIPIFYGSVLPVTEKYVKNNLNATQKMERINAYNQEVENYCYATKIEPLTVTVGLLDAEGKFLDNSVATQDQYTLRDYTKLYDNIQGTIYGSNYNLNETDGSLDAITTETMEIILKGCVGAKPSDYYTDEMLVESLQIGDFLDDVRYPVNPPYIYTHFGINDLTMQGVESYKNLLLALKSKYKNKPIFVAKELKVNSSYPNYVAVNEQIDLFNAQMLDFANQEPYIIQLDISRGLTKSGLVDPQYVTNGMRFDIKVGAERYYNIVKKCILKKAIGGTETDKPDSKPSTKKVNVTLTSMTNKDYGRLKEFTFKLPASVSYKYWAKVKFTTNINSEPTKVKQCKHVYMEGTDCKKGALVPKADTTYTITFMPSTEGDTVSKKYIGTVSGVVHGGKYKDFPDFIGKKSVYDICMSYNNNKNKFRNNTTTPVDFTNPESNKSRWYTGGLYNIDCSSFVKIVYMGYEFKNSPYQKAMTKQKRNVNFGWSFTLPRVAAEQAEYCVNKGWIMEGIDMVNFTNIEAGDILFYDRDDEPGGGKYMSISHSAIAMGNGKLIEVMNITGAFRIINIKDAVPSRLLLVARPRKE